MTSAFGYDAPPFNTPGSGGGGGGGGDVTAAGANNFSGVNTFNNQTFFNDDVYMNSQLVMGARILAQTIFAQRLQTIQLGFENADSVNNIRNADFSLNGFGIYLVDTSGGAVNVDVDPAVYPTGTMVTITDFAGNAGVSPIILNGSDINGLAAYVINTPYGSVTMINTQEVNTLGAPVWRIIAKA